jgi:SHAQKYF class myb-like DNA-binding protein
MVKKIKFFCSLQKKENKKQGRWSQEEQDRFLKGCYFFKNDWEKIKEYIKTRTIPQIRSHAQKYLIKICRKYSIRLSKKKFSNRQSKHLDITKIPYKGKSNISNMSIYEKNILEMFNYYNREVLKDETTPGSDNNEEQIKNIQLYNNYNIPSNNNKFDQTSFNINNLNNVSNIDINKNIIEKENTIEKNFDTNENLQINNNFSYSVNQLQSFPMSLSPSIIQNMQNNNSLEPTDISSLPQNPNINMNNYLFNYNNLNSQNSQTKQFINYYTNNINQNKYLIQNEYEFYLMNKISYYNTILLNTIKTNQKINENILLLLGYNSNNNINANIINKSNINYNSKDKIIN